MSSNLGTIPPKLANINRAWGDGYTSNWTVQRCFQKFCSVDQSLEDKKGRGQVYSLDNEQLQAIVSKLLGKIHDKVPKKCLRHLLSALHQHCNSFI